MDAKSTDQEPRSTTPRTLRGDAGSGAGLRGEAQRTAELDGLRGLAAAAIVFYHCGTQRLPGGWAAVDLFFVLSGYLITSIIVTHGGSPGFLKTFYIRRFLRIGPIYYLTVAIVAGVWLFVPARVRWAGLPYTLTYTQLMGLHAFKAQPDFSPFLWHTWSLAVEEQFYLIWPLLLLAVGRRRLVAAACACIGVAVLGRAGGWNWIILGARCDALAAGGLLAHVLAERPATARRGRALEAWFAVVSVIGLASLLAVAGTAGINLPAGPPRWPAVTLLAVNAIWFGVVGLVILHSGKPVVHVLRTRPLVYLGRISYGLYLYHFVVIRIAFEVVQALGYGPRVPWVKAPAVALSFVLAALSWKYIERPILDRKDGYRYRPSPEALTSEPHTGGVSPRRAVRNPV